MLFEHLHKQKEIIIFRYPSENAVEPEQELDQFLSSNRGCLITSQLLFKGSEAESIFSLQELYSASSNVRGTILRSVSRLYILNGIDEVENMSIRNAKNDDSFLHCFKSCECLIYECKTCNEGSEDRTMICLPCKRKCHGGHQFELKLVGIYGDYVSGNCLCKFCSE